MHRCLTPPLSCRKSCSTEPGAGRENWAQGGGLLTIDEAISAPADEWLIGPEVLRSRPNQMASDTTLGLLLGTASRDNSPRYRVGPSTRSVSGFPRLDQHLGAASGAGRICSIKGLGADLIASCLLDPLESARIASA